MEKCNLLIGDGEPLVRKGAMRRGLKCLEEANIFGHHSELWNFI